MKRQKSCEQALKELGPSGYYNLADDIEQSAKQYATKAGQGQCTRMEFEAAIICDTGWWAMIKKRLKPHR